jgi:outer membrane immunogenic protein
MKKLLLAGTALGGLALAGPALAADLPVKAPPVVAPAVFSWTGCYIGGHVGGARGQKEWSDFTGDLGDAFGGFIPVDVTSRITVASGSSTTFVSSGTTGVTTTIRGPTTLLLTGTGRTQTITSISDDTAGFLGGGQVGCDIQFAPRLVFGIAGEGSWSNTSGTVDGTFVTGTTPLFLDDFAVVSPTVPPFVAGAFSAHTVTEWIASVTARLGYTPWDRWLFYVKGGAAWAGDKYSLSGQFCTGGFTFPPATGSCNSSANAFDFRARETRFGYTTGLGVEYAFFDGWTAFLEWDYYNFGRRHVDFTDIAGQACPGCVGDAEIHQQINALKFGINYRFGFIGKAPAPVVARY